MNHTTSQSLTNTSENLFEVLASIDCSQYVEQKKSGNGVSLSYLSWAWAWSLLKQAYPDATYSVREWDGKPYLYDENLGYLVETSLTCGGATLTQRLPVMDGANKAMKATEYTYRTFKGEKTVAPATMFDINTAIQRCLVKNIAMFGLGLNLYAGEDLPVLEEIAVVNGTSKRVFGDSDKKEMDSIESKDALIQFCANRKRSLLPDEVGKLSAYYKKIVGKFGDEN